MRVVFFASDKPREQALARAFLAGAQRHGCEVVQRALCGSPDVSGADAIAMVGVKSKRLFELTRAAGAVPVMLDKGYVRTRVAGARVWEYWRVSVGAHHPTQTTLMIDCKVSADRFDALELGVAPWRRRGLQVVIAGSSAKYHDFYGLEPPNDYYARLVAEIRARTDRPIVYRPKPSFKDARRIKGAYMSHGSETIVGALEGAWVLVTHGSNACFEAALAGVPSIILGDGVAAPISSTSLEDIDEPKTERRGRWLSSLAYHQYTEDEFRSGEAWRHIRGWIDGQKKT